MSHRTIAAFVLSLALAGPAWAGRNRADSPPPTDAQLAQSRKTGSDNSLAAQRHRQEVQRLLNKLEAGQNVDPAEVERVLRHSLED